MGSYKLRIIINEEDIRKVSLDGKPETVEELKIKVKEKCKLQDDFNLMYEDPDFGYSLCNLNDIGDLPATKATVKVIPLVTLTLVPASTTTISDASNASDDTEILSTCSSSLSTRQEQWPEFFDIPNFSVDVGDRLILSFYKTKLTLMYPET